MRCGHCKTEGSFVTIEHVRACSTQAQDPRGTRTPVTEAGMYRLDGDIYKVQVAVHGSGHLYAKRLVRTAEGTVVFDYLPGAIKRLAAEDRLTLADAAEYGALYGNCMVCGRTLTRESSIEAGIGPVCAGKV